MPVAEVDSGVSIVGVAEFGAGSSKVLDQVVKIINKKHSSRGRPELSKNMLASLASARLREK